MKISELDETRFMALREASEKSEKRIRELSELNNSYKGEGIALVVTGSLARREITEASDFDAFLVAEQTDGDPPKAKELWDAAKSLMLLNDPSKTGAFGNKELVNFGGILENIGGNNDNNIKITQRMLIVLESIAFGDVDLYESLKKEIVDRYISDSITNHQLGMFILNDVIRYYRTICVDFEYKTHEESKPWGIRNIKLVYSRKLIYFAGLLMCAELAQRSYVQKRQIFLDLMRIPPLERILQIMGSDVLRALDHYENFLAALSDEGKRNELLGVTSGERNKSSTFVDLKNGGHHFAWALKSAFERHYDSSHPIHKAIIF